MADIELVIKISKDTYRNIKNGFYDENARKMAIAIGNGVILPKGHGRLIDADELKKEYPHDTCWDYPVNTNSYVVRSIDDSSTIIEADKSEGKLEQESAFEIKTVTNAEEAEVYPISENISKGFEEFTRMMFRQRQAESEGDHERLLET